MEQPLRWRRWLVLVAAGELVGFVVPAVTGVLVRDAPASVQLAILPVAGLVEGATLGFAQAVVLRRSWAAFETRAWVVATSVAAAAAWFLGMLPSNTHGAWSSWPTVWVVTVAAVLGACLLASIGTAQALVLPPGTRGRCAWVGWTSLGWCAGLIAFSVVAPPLWQPNQPLWLLILIGVLGGVAMAVAMAAVTGVGALRLVEQAHSDQSETGFTPGRHLVSRLLGTVVYDATGRRLGRVRDLVADLDRDTDLPPVTRVLVDVPGGPSLIADYSDLVRRADRSVSLSGTSDPAPSPVAGTTEVLLRRDVLDAPVVLAEPPRRTRVSDVVVEVGPRSMRVVGVDVGPVGVIRRLARRASLGVQHPVPLPRVHLASRHGHAAQLAAPGSPVLELSADDLAEVLTRVPVAHARDIIDAADERVREDAVHLLHPHVRARVTGNEPPPRRTRRFAGWRLHRPGHPPAQAVHD